LAYFCFLPPSCTASRLRAMCGGHPPKFSIFRIPALSYCLPGKNRITEFSVVFSLSPPLRVFVPTVVIPPPSIIFFLPSLPLNRFSPFFFDLLTPRPGSFLFFKTGVPAWFFLIQLHRFLGAGDLLDLQFLRRRSIFFFTTFSKKASFALRSPAGVLFIFDVEPITFLGLPIVETNAFCRGLLASILFARFPLRFFIFIFSWAGPVLYFFDFTPFPIRSLAPQCFPLECGWSGTLCHRPFHCYPRPGGRSPRIIIVLCWPPSPSSPTQSVFFFPLPSRLLGRLSLPPAAQVLDAFRFSPHPRVFPPLHRVAKPF